MRAGNQWRLGHRPALDGLRGVAILLVLGAHAFPGVVENAGSIGVTVFFALSGFLITALLLDEKASTGRISLRRFYARRARRLLPALGVFLVATSAAIVLVPGVMQTPWRYVAASGLYVENWLQATATTVPAATSITWSLCVEEQFYLFWPLILILGRRWPRLPATVLVVGIVYAPLARLAFWHQGDGLGRVYYGTDTRVDCLFLGCALAMYVKSRGAAEWWRRLLPVGAVLLALTLLPPYGGYTYVLAPLPVAVATCMMIAGVLSGRQAALSIAPLRWFGKRSYALYLYHYPLVWFLPRHGIPMWVAVAVALIAAEVSWRLIEQPIRQATTTVAIPAASQVIVNVPAVVDTSAPKST